jgi:hypothetical protein
LPVTSSASLLAVAPSISMRSRSLPNSDLTLPPRPVKLTGRPQCRKRATLSVCSKTKRPIACRFERQRVRQPLELLELGDCIVGVLEQLEGDARNFVLVVGNALADPIKNHLLYVAVAGDHLSKLFDRRPVRVLGLRALATELMGTRAITTRLLDFAQSGLDRRMPANSGKLLQRVLQTLQNELAGHRQA